MYGSSGSLSELLECAHVARRGVAWSEACLVDRLIGVQCGLWTSEEELAEEFARDGDRTDGSNSWMVRTGLRSCI